MKLKNNSIVKVQIPIICSPGNYYALVYNKSRSYEVYMEITKEVLKVMKKEYKKFFYASYDKKNNNTVLINEAPWQEW